LIEMSSRFLDDFEKTISAFVKYNGKTKVTFWELGW
jgi:hypothetical protein